MAPHPTQAADTAVAASAAGAIVTPSSDMGGGDDMKGEAMPTDAEVKVTADIEALTAQVSAAKEAGANETDDVKAAKALLAAAKVLDNALSYASVWERDEVKANLGNVKGAATKLRTVSELIAPVTVFDRSEGTAIAARLKMAVAASEAGYLPAELGTAASEALTAWSGVKGGGGGGGPRSPKGEGKLGYVLKVKHASWEKPLEDSTGKGSAMSSALGKLGGAMEPKISGAARATWQGAGQETTYDNLAKAIDEVIKGGADGAEYGDWTVEAEGRKPAASTADRAA